MLRKPRQKATLVDVAGEEKQVDRENRLQDPRRNSYETEIKDCRVTGEGRVPSMPSRCMQDGKFGGGLESWRRDARKLAGQHWQQEFEMEVE
ncbi:hypothetical protein VCV18_010249 [Metarhizium anisopliae]